jgi:hypothetical protein
MVIMANINNLITIANQCPRAVRVQFRETKTAQGKNDIFTVGANEGWSGQEWIPWADSDSDLAKHFILVDATSGHDMPSAGNANYFPRIKIFQSGSDICFVGDNGAGMSSYDNRVTLSGGGGLGATSGERSLVLSRSDNSQLIAVIG